MKPTPAKDAPTKDQAKRLSDLEAIIEDGWRKSGQALLLIRDDNLWKGTYKSWSDYCEKRWGWSKQHCNRLIAGTEAVKSLPAQVEPMGSTLNERQARELAKLAPEDRAQVVQEVAKNGKVTAKAIAAEVSKRLPKVDDTLILIGCVKEKLETEVPVPAKDLYISQLFKSRMAYAERAGKPWAILSAKYGLLWPTDLVSPYEVQINDLSQDQQDDLMIGVHKSLTKYFGGEEGLTGRTVEIHAGLKYVRAVREVEESFDITISAPMEGLGIGEQLLAYKRLFGGEIKSLSEMKRANVQEPPESAFAEKEQARIEAGPAVEVEKLVAELREIADAIEEDVAFPDPGDEVDFDVVADQLVRLAEQIRSLKQTDTVPQPL